VQYFSGFACYESILPKPRTWARMLRVKTYVKWISVTVGILAILGVGGWISSPWLLKHYINTHVEGVQVASAKLKNLDCVQLNGVHINVANNYGVLNHVTACYKAKTIDADGGTLNITLTKDEGSKKSKGYKITARNINVTLRVEGRTIEITGASMVPGRACGKVASIKFGLGTVMVSDVCVDLNTHQIMFENGSAFLTQLFGHKVGLVKFGQGRVNPDSKVADLQFLSREPFMVRGLHVELNGTLATVKAESIVGSHKRIYKDPLTLKGVVIGPVGIGAPLDRAVQVSSRGATLTIDISRWHVEGKESCQTWLDAVPDELKDGPISEMKLAGNFAIDLTIKPEVHLKISNQCTLAKVPSPKFIQALAGRFKYTAYHPDGKPFERETGPGTSDWVPLQLISPNMGTALTTTEDPGFLYHRGIIPQAIENSLKDNLKLGKFFRGGSTLTMQVAKNLWLSRTRTLGRKLQEAILTVALESSLSKDKILELYLNIVEYGPNLYGIGPASKELLHKDPLDLSISDSMYLVLRLPAPNHSASYEQMRGMIGKLLDNAMKAGKVTEDLVEVEKGLLQTPSVNLDDD
jgi:hypothetical protein